MLHSNFSEVIMQVKSVSVESLLSDPSNVRLHNDKNLDAIKGSLAKFGQQKPIVVDKNNVVIAGNGTLAAAKCLGWATINVVITDLDTVDKTAFAIADNRTAEMAEWDMPALSEQLKSLDEFGVNLDDIGFGASFLDDMSLDDDFEFSPSGDDNADASESLDLKISFTNPGDKSKLFKELNERGFKVKSL